MARFILFVVLIAVNAQFVLAQSPGSSPAGGVLDGAFVPRTNRTKQLMPYPPLDESHVLYLKRVERRIPLHEKLNHPLFFPLSDLGDRQSLVQLIIATLEDESSSVSVYKARTTSLTDEIRAKEFQYNYRLPRDSAVFLMMGYEEPQPPSTEGSMDEEVESDVKIPDTLRAEIGPEEIIAFDIKEDWIFDKHRSQWYCRIIGIAPVARLTVSWNPPPTPDVSPTRNVKATQLAWLYFPEWRHVFQHGYASAGTFNPYNDTGRPTFLELFEDRRFSSYIIKESNVYDRSISSYAQGEDALLESERIKNELFTMEHDLWHY
jgi:gliding motility associated protien GldN